MQKRHAHNLRHDSAFGFLRLFFAALVIVSHGPELIDGNRAREPLSMLFGTLSAGDVGVYGFFFISGYLITGSFLNSSGPSSYLRKRIGRIYPGFIAASIVSIFVVGPLAGAALSDMTHGEIAHAAVRTLTLHMPILPGAFATLPVPFVNGSMWSISHEFRCYLLILALGWAGMLAHRRLIALLAALGVVLTMLDSDALYRFIESPPLIHAQLLGDGDDFVHLTMFFLVGATYYLYRERLVFNAGLIFSAAAALVVTMSFPHTAAAGLALFGGYLILAAAAWGATNRLATVNASTDISYGVYLYAFPIAQLLIYYVQGIGPVGVVLATLPLAALCGWLSWHLVEKPAMQWINPARRRPDEAPVKRAPAPAPIARP
jgi:peptidoglycan/LPS O-acetylase OafA/YrhL